MLICSPRYSLVVEKELLLVVLLITLSRLDAVEEDTLLTDERDVLQLLLLPCLRKQVLLLLAL